MALNPRADADKILALLNQGQFKQAFKAAKAATKSYPRESFFANLAGTALAQQGNEREAITWFQKALRLNPDNPDAQNNLVQALISIGQPKKALELIGKILPKRPDRPNVLHFKALALMNAGHPDAAMAALDEALSLTPNNARALTLRGMLRADHGDEEGALSDYEAALRLDPKAPDTLTNMSLVLTRLHRMDDAMRAVETALSINPRHLAALQRRAVLLNELGRQSDAVAAYRRLLEAAPGDAEAMMDLSLIAPAQDREALLAEVDAALSHTAKAAPGLPFLALAKAQLLTKLGKGEDAARWFKTGNAALAKQRPFDTAEAEREFDRITDLFQSLPDPADPAEPRPIFILGLPRSGTTLTEQIITSHPGIFGCGELATAGRIVRNLLEADIAPEDLDPAQFAEDYRKTLPPMPENTVAFVDKMPANYRYVGFLLPAFPNAVILHVTRDPRDVALSMWRTFFSSPAMSFTCDQKAMAAQLNLYRRYMDFWGGLYQDRLIDVPYGALVRDIEAMSRKLANTCGVDWLPEMALPEKNTAPVLTASAAQVREGVHARSLGGWEKHQDMLAEFIAGLDPALWPELQD
ncbi:tetratricopeptide repeat-containing sulfotransferase family protein [Thalassovita mangrovi]|uniref:Tetratricopeptide repeat protein n=1 Tax=Thalassovita mangrovi TaxID=2692236 RepID=A0A6L8LPE0_9RHOB|nr:tetratricopeptide repeat-containing sulfotransferase family protein [Thalassovita mangrovi]MYM55502.1 tetratricopeptide repeat protein [Thalassovita mangrovi]